MSTEIYYFSGTGNSLVVARDIAEKINGKIIPIVSLLDQENINTNADVIGFVFPIHDYRPLPLIEQFIKKIANLNSKYIFAVCTYGIIPLGAMKIFEQNIKACGGEISSGYAVKMPHNGLGISGSNEEQNKRFKRWRIKLEIISENINSRKQGKPEVMNIPVHYILSGLFFSIMLPYLNVLWHVARKGGWNSLSLISNNKCNGCGICMKICPMNNIEMVDNKPKWFEHCVSCFACLQWCPKEAINAGSMTEGMPRYHHPDVKKSDIIKQKEDVKKSDYLWA